MVQSSATTVDLWLDEIGPDRRDAIERMRAACLAAFPDWQERMQWGMPGYGPAGEDARVSFNNQKGHISLYIGKTVLDAHAAELKGASLGKGCVRYANAAKIDWAVVEAMLADGYRANTGPC